MPQWFINAEIIRVKYQNKARKGLEENTKTLEATSQCYVQVAAELLY